MLPEMIYRFRFFFAWQDEEEEIWLREMSQKGWHLESAHLPGIYIFRHGEPMDYVYRLDYRTRSRKDFLSYLQIFSDAGWDYIDEMNNWQYFRKLARPGSVPDIYTDSESKIAKYQRVLTSLYLLFPGIVVSLMFIAGGIKEDRYPAGVFVLLLVIMAAIAILYGVAFVKIRSRIDQLRRV